MKNVVVVVCCVGCENVVELCKNVEVVKMWDSRSRAEKLLKLCKNVEVVKNVVVVVFFEKCGNDLNCVKVVWK